MNKHTFFRIITVVLTLVMILAAARPVYANEPVINKYVLDSWYTKTDICSFPISVHETGLIITKEWYDGDGVLSREMYTYGGNIYYLSANDKTVTVKHSGTVKTTYVSAFETRVTVTGQDWVWSIPGLGMVSGGVGKADISYIYDPNGNLIDTITNKLVGKIMWTDVTPLLCGYMAP